MTKCQITCKSLQKSSKCQNFLRVWHLVIFRADQLKKPPCIFDTRISLIYHNIYIVPCVMCRGLLVPEQTQWPLNLALQCSVATCSENQFLPSSAICVRNAPHYKFCVFFNTRPGPAYGRQGLDWIAGPGCILRCSQCLASCLWRSARLMRQLGKVLIFFVLLTAPPSLSPLLLNNVKTARLVKRGIPYRPFAIWWGQLI